MIGVSRSNISTTLSTSSGSVDSTVAAMLSWRMNRLSRANSWWAMKRFMLSPVGVREESFAPRRRPSQRGRRRVRERETAACAAARSVLPGRAVEAENLHDFGLFHDLGRALLGRVGRRPALAQL